MQSVEILRVRVDNVNDSQLGSLFIEWLHASKLRAVYTPNPEMLLEAQSHEWFQKVLNTADLSLPDGAGVLYAAAALYDVDLYRHTGVDTLQLLAQIAAHEHKHLLLVGGHGGVAEEAAHRLQESNSNLKVTFFEPGLVSLDAEGVLGGADIIFSEINERNLDIVAVALGQKKQEMFIAKMREECPNVKIAIGIGGAFDMISNNTPRAPYFMRRWGLEWIWRWKLEPHRMHRMFNAVIRFPAIIVWVTMRQRRFLKGTLAVFKRLFRHD